MLVTEITACRSCGSPSLQSVLDLGTLAISSFLLPGEKEEYAPLELVCCHECSLVQLRHTVDRDYLYREQYWYKSGVNESMVAALRDVVRDAMEQVTLQPEDKVLDIGCNDGSLLSFYPSYVNRYGYEPATNLWEEAKKRSGGCIYPTYFPQAGLPRDQYKVISAIAQFYNVTDPNAYVAAIKECLHPEGVWLVQFQDLPAMLTCYGYDNVCHEHTLYLERRSFEHLLNRHGLVIEDVTYNQTNGGSARYVIRHGKAEAKPVGAVEIVALLAALANFRRRTERNRQDLQYVLRQLKADGKSVVGVAASTKFNTLAQYSGLTPELLPAIADRSADKTGRLTVGTHIPIIDEKELYARHPDYLLACAWHFLAPFRARYASLEEAGTKWLVPLPEVHFVGGEEPCHPSIAVGLSARR